MQNPHYRRPRSPEDPPLSAEVGDGLSELLEGVQELAVVTKMSAADFVLMALEEAEKNGIEIDADISAIIIARGFGSPEETWERIRSIPPAVFVEQYPGPVGQMLLDFIAPLFDPY